MASFSFTLAYSLTVAGTNFGSFQSVMDGQSNSTNNGAAVLNTVLVAGQYPGASIQDQALAFVNAGGWTEQGTVVVPESEVGSGTTIRGLALDGNTGLLGYVIAGSGGGGPAVGFGAWIMLRSLTGTWSVGAQLSTGDAESGDSWGTAAALSGNWAVVGASETALHTGGAVYVYFGSGASWELTQTLVPADLSASDEFGGNNNGQLLIVGGWLFAAAPAQNSSAGAVYVFRLEGSTWVQVQKLTTGIAGDQFGSYISCDGSTLAIGAPQDPRAGTATGKALLYTLVGGLWTLQQTVVGSDSADGDGFGSSVAVSSSLLAVGAPNNNSNAGAVYIFQSSSPWSQVQKITQPATANTEFFGQTVSAFNAATAQQLAVGSANTGAPNDSSIFIYSSFVTVPGPYITLSMKGMKVY